MARVPTAAVLAEMDRAREATLRRVSDLPDHVLCDWPDAEFSPVGWHLGHLAFTEALWIVGPYDADDSLHAPRARAFAQGGRPKHERSDLPCRRELLGYLGLVRSRVRRVAGRVAHAAADDPLLRAGFLWWFLAAHEHQHRETMTFVLTQRCLRRPGSYPNIEGVPLEAIERPALPTMVPVPGGEITLGTDAPLAYDNERPAHRRELAPCHMDDRPVLCSDWARFMRAGGYNDRGLWTPRGWAWLSGSGARAPYSWVEVMPGRWAVASPAGLHPLDGRAPVWGVSHHEAEAFARWRGARLPTEAEWEHARQLGCIGPTRSVWEWTSSWFEPYPGFEPFPYRGYSVPYFGGTHRVLRGGSFATDPVIARPTFRNWYQPHIRQIFSGLRCARDDR